MIKDIFKDIIKIVQANSTRTLEGPKMHCSIYSSKVHRMLLLIKNPENRLCRGQIYRGEAHISKNENVLFQTNFRSHAVIFKLLNTF